MYLSQRPKSKNWASLMPHSSAIVRRTEKSTDSGNSLALGLQCGVYSICLQCIPWPVACSEWGACLTDFDFQIFRLRHPNMIRIGLKSWSVCPRPDTCRRAKFHPNPCTRFWVGFNLANRQTDRQTSRAIACTFFLSEVKNHFYLCRKPILNQQTASHIKSR